jgi:hypothetical protein
MAYERGFFNVQRIHEFHHELGIVFHSPWIAGFVAVAKAGKIQLDHSVLRVDAGGYRVICRHVCSPALKDYDHIVPGSGFLVGNLVSIYDNLHVLTLSLIFLCRPIVPAIFAGNTPDRQKRRVIFLF